MDKVYGRYASFLDKLELKKADKYIKRVFPNAEYYVDYELGALVFEPLENEEVDLEDRTVINEKGYKGTFTSKYRDLVKLIFYCGLKRRWFHVPHPLSV